MGGDDHQDDVASIHVITRRCRRRLLDQPRPSAVVTANGGAVGLPRDRPPAQLCPCTRPLLLLGRPAPGGRRPPGA